MKEIWKDIDGFEGIYQVSNLGRIKSLPRQVGTVYKKEMIRKLSYTHDGYIKIRLNANGKDITTRVHRLVAIAFIPKIDGKTTVNHIDGDKTNNRADNLEWMNRTEQLQHAYDNNLKQPQRGDTHINAKLTKEQVENIRKEYIKGSKEYSSTKLAIKYNVSHRTIINIINNKTYSK